MSEPVHNDQALRSPATTGVWRGIAENVEQVLGEVIDAAELGPELRDAVRYALLGGGKRLRPTLAWLACEAVGAQGERSLPAGIAVEMVHAFSLVHDDLPAMDDDDLRRGLPTLHIRSGEAMAILAGDALLSLCAEVLVDRVEQADLALELIRELTRGTRGMIDGQVFDTLGSEVLDAMPGRDAVAAIHQRKTGALLLASLRMGAMCGQAALGRPIDGEPLSRIDAYGRAIGLMFQAVDDLLDVEATPEQVGKRTGKDAQAGKRTYPECIGVDATRELIADLLTRAEQAIQPMGKNGAALVQMARWLARRER